MTDTTATMTEMRYRSLKLSDPHVSEKEPTEAHASAFPKGYVGGPSLLLGFKNGPTTFSLYVTPDGARDFAALLVAQADYAEPPISDGTESHGPDCTYRMSHGLAGCDCRDLIGYETCATCSRPLGNGQTHEPDCEARPGWLPRAMAAQHEPR